jgi:glycosyltransferase involved in cell wall biosynthesis
MSSVSVVIPSYNGGRWVAEAVESVLAQTSPAGQIIVVDDGSTDDTRARLEGYRERGVEYVYQENRGVAAARNAGVERVRGELIAFLDADDWWHPRKLEIQCEVMGRRADLGMLGTGVFDWPGKVESVRGEGEVNGVEFGELAVKNYFTTSSVVVRRSVLEGVGDGSGRPFDTELHGPEDFDLWLRIVERAGAGNLSLPLTGYRTVEGSLGKRAVSMEAGMRRILEKMDARGSWKRMGGGRMLRAKAWAYFRYSCAYLYGAGGHHGSAAWRVLRSMARYPVPFGRSEVRMPLARPKLLGMSLMRLMRLRRWEGTERSGAGQVVVEA